MVHKFLILIVLLVLCVASVPHAQVTRNVYLSPIDGAGTDANPFRARCFGMAGAGAIDLRPWGINRFLCASNTLPANMTGIRQLGDALDKVLDGATKAELETLAAKALAATNVREAIIEILSNRLRAGRDGKLKIFLGEQIPLYQQTAGIPFRDNGLFADAALGLVELASTIERYTIGAGLAWAASFTEDFNCANTSGGSLSCDLTWSEPIGTTTLCGITSNEASCSGSGSMMGRADADTATDDHDVQITMKTLTNGSGADAYFTVVARKDSSATATYYGFIVADDVNPYFTVYVRSAGSRTDLATDSTDYANGDVLKIRTDGTSITGYRNGAILIGPVTDATISGNTRGGFRYNGSDATSSATADDFSIIDVLQDRNRRAVMMP